VITDQNFDETFVIMDLDSYENLVTGKNVGQNSNNSPVDALVDKINQDIALTQAEENEPEINLDFSSKSSNFSEKIAEAEDDDKYYIEPVE